VEDMQRHHGVARTPRSNVLHDRANVTAVDQADGVFDVLTAAPSLPFPIAPGRPRLGARAWETDVV